MYLHLDIDKKLNDFRLQVSCEGNASRIGILGASGCGKSMTLKSIAGIEKPDKGRIVLGDRTLFDTSGKINLRPQVPGSKSRTRAGSFWETGLCSTLPGRSISVLRRAGSAICFRIMRCSRL